MAKTVTIYSTQTCGYCKTAKQFFDENKVTYEDIDVGVNKEEAKKMIEKTGQMGVPVFIVHDDAKEDVVIGYDRKHLANLLGINVA
jgi:glutaredoxin